VGWFKGGVDGGDEEEMPGFVPCACLADFECTQGVDHLCGRVFLGGRASIVRGGMDHRIELVREEEGICGISQVKGDVAAMPPGCEDRILRP